MSSDSIIQREAKLRDAFCDAKARSILKPAAPQETPQQHRQTLADESGIKDDQLLDRLISLGVKADTLAAVSLVPLIQVAWSDEDLHANEQSAVLTAAKESGLGREAYELLKHWLSQKPNVQLLAAWKGYVRELSASADQQVKEKLKADVIGRARRVAEAAGGILGYKTVSAKEEAALSELEEAFD